MHPGARHQGWQFLPRIATCIRRHERPRADNTPGHLREVCFTAPTAARVFSGCFVLRLSLIRIEHSLNLVGIIGFRKR